MASNQTRGGPQSCSLAAYIQWDHTELTLQLRLVTLTGKRAENQLAQL